MTTTTDTDFAARGRSVLQFGRDAGAEAWKSEWTPPQYALGEPESCWTHFTLTTVADFEAELGFWLDAIGLDVFMLQQPTDEQPDTFRMAMLNAPDRSFIVGIREADDEHAPAPAGSTAFEFMTKDLPTAWSHIVGSGAEVVREPWDDGWMDRAQVRTPSGHLVQLWSLGDRRDG